MRRPVKMLAFPGEIMYFIEKSVATAHYMRNVFLKPSLHLLKLLEIFSVSLHDVFDCFF